MPALPSLNLHRHDRGHHTTITLAGEIDMDAAPSLRALVEDCLREGIRTIDIDLTALAFCDLGGLNAFLAAAERASSAEGSLRLNHPRPNAARLLDLTGTGFLLQPVPAPEPPAAGDPVAAGRRGLFGFLARAGRYRPAGVGGGAPGGPG
jgi:anti-sigma B factor antagonist